MKSLLTSPLRHNIAGIPCDFLSERDFSQYVSTVVATSPLPNWGEGGGEGSKEEKCLTHIITLNAEMVVEAQKNKSFREIIKKAELVIPDGSSMLWARDYIRTPQRGSRVQPGMTRSLLSLFFSKEKTLTGVDSIFLICEAVEKNKGSVAFIGGTTQEREKAATVLRKKYPALIVVALPPTTYNLQPVDAVFVALGSPKQSLWIEEHRKQLEQFGIRIAMGVGGAFAMVAGSLPRAPKWMRRHHIEWLWRLILEPARIKRIWNAVVIFPILVQKTDKQSGYPH